MTTTDQPVAKRCSFCGTLDSVCFAAGIWRTCCAGCDDTDRRSHPSTLPQSSPSSPPSMTPSHDWRFLIWSLMCVALGVLLAITVLS